MRRVLFPLSVALTPVMTLMACQQPDGQAAAKDGAAGSTVRTTASASATSSADSDTPGPAAGATANATSISEKLQGGEFTMEYSWPAAVSAIPALARRLGEERDRIAAEEKAEWREMIVDCPKDAVSCRNRSFGKEWKVVANLPSYLSLSADVSTYRGGAHGNYGMESLVWDKRRGEAVEGIDLFRSPEALGEAVAARYCKALDQKRFGRRGIELPSDDPFSDCPTMDELAVLVGSSNGKTFDRMTLYAAPYVAGSYAEGAYEVDLDIDRAVIAAVKPAYRRDFSVRR